MPSHSERSDALKAANQSLISALEALESRIDKQFTRNRPISTPHIKIAPKIQTVPVTKKLTNKQSEPVHIISVDNKKTANKMQVSNLLKRLWKFIIR